MFGPHKYDENYGFWTSYLWNINLIFCLKLFSLQFLLFHQQ